METVEQSLDTQLAESQKELEQLREKRALARATAEAARIAYVLGQQQAQEPQRKAEAEANSKQDRKMFADAAKTLRSFAVNEANFSLLRQVLGHGNLSAYGIQQAIASNAVVLSPATQTELDEWKLEAIEAHNEFLRNADGATLRAVARQESQAKQIASQQEQAAREDQARSERDSRLGYPPIPKIYNGQLLDSFFIKKASAETLRGLIKRFGPAQVTDVLRNRN